MSRGGGTSSYSMANQPPDIPTSTPTPAPVAPTSGGLRKVDPEIFAAVVAEEERQRENIELIALERLGRELYVVAHKGQQGSWKPKEAC